MLKKQTMKAEQIEAAKTLLRSLPSKEQGKSREETASLLTKDFRAALKKGYTIKEISDLLKKSGLSIPASFVKSCLTIPPNNSGQLSQK